MVSKKLLIFACLIAAGSALLTEKSLGLNVDLSVGLNVGDILKAVFKTLSDLLGLISDILGFGYKKINNSNDMMCFGHDAAKGLGALLTKSGHAVPGKHLGNMVAAITACVCVTSPYAGAHISYCRKGYRGGPSWIGYTRKRIPEIFNKYGVKHCKREISQAIEQKGGLNKYSGSTQALLKLCIELSDYLKVDITLAEYKLVLKKIIIAVSIVYYSYTNGNEKLSIQLIIALFAQTEKGCTEIGLDGWSPQDPEECKREVTKYRHDSAIWHSKCGFSEKKD